MNPTFSRRSPFGMSFPQALGTGASPTFAGLTISGGSTQIALQSGFAGASVKVRNTANAAFAAIDFYDDADALQGFVGYGNSGSTLPSTVYFGTQSANPISIRTNGTERWNIGGSTGHLLGVTATGGVGYGTGAGGAVTQGAGSGKATGVTLNTVTGVITMDGAALAADTTVSFVLTDSAIAATDAVVVLHQSAGTLGAYSFASTAAAGSATIAVHNNTPGSLSEAIVLRFIVLKSVNA